MVNDKSPRVIQVIQSYTYRGKGIEGDPCRMVMQIHTLGGEFVAESDPSSNFYRVQGDKIKNEQEE